MSEKFKYAPGKPGFGTKGDPGINGNQGLSIYFTDLNPVSQSLEINTRIKNNKVLFASTPDISLPSNRIYITGDLFIDSTGGAWEINAEIDTFSIIGNINLGGFFVPLGISSSEGYERYFNSNSSPKYIIDNVYTDAGAVDYTQTPSFIYGIAPVNFTRIEYTNVKNESNYNAFTAYTIGSDDNKGFAIIYDELNKTFRIGNVGNGEIIRDTNITFDVSSLIVTKQNGINTFNKNTLPGTILTNYEIDANCLFDPIFNREPSSFYTQISGNDCSIFWNLEDFTNDLNISADLYLYEDITSFNGNTYSIDSSIIKPLIFSNIDISGNLRITNLKNLTPYSCYIKLNKNGWIRKSSIKSIFPGILTVSPNTFIEPSGGSINKGIDINSNIEWNYELIQNPSDFIYNIISSSTGYDGSLYFDVSTNLNPARTGIIRLTPKGGAHVDVSIYQQTPYISIQSILTLDSTMGTNDNKTAIYTLNTDASLPGTTAVNLTLDWWPSADNNMNAIENGQSYHTADITVSAPGKGTVTLPNESENLYAQESWNPAGYSWNNLLTNCTSSNFPITISITASAQIMNHPTSGDMVTTVASFKNLKLSKSLGSPLTISYNTRLGAIQADDIIAGDIPPQ
ncbi:hypothetical protein M0Q50_06035 [bacterium]|jgi:hypothetical protein|nr:hypothetical protein [bacterium]